MAITVCAACYRNQRAQPLVVEGSPACWFSFAPVAGSRAEVIERATKVISSFGFATHSRADSGGTTRVVGGPERVARPDVYVPASAFLLLEAGIKTDTAVKYSVTVRSGRIGGGPLSSDDSSAVRSTVFNLCRRLTDGISR